MKHRYFQYLIVFLAGLFAVFGFAPYYYFFSPIVALTVLFYFCILAPTAQQSFWLGMAFGLGLYGFGIYWIYICLHEFGGMPWWFAGISTFCLCAFMALFPALVGYFGKRLDLFWLTGPVLWGVSDWVRSWIFTGFPWLTLGYSQVPHSPMVGYLPIVGVYGVSIITALVASMIAYWLAKPTLTQTFKRNAIAAIALIMVVGVMLKAVDWTAPISKQISVALVQGNIDQHIKWSPEYAQHTIDLYLNMYKSVQANLIVLPETALPVIESQLAPKIKTILTQHAQQNNGNVIIGLVQYNPNTQQYLNSALSYGVNDTQTYSKNHLVPFGEFIPLKAVFGWVYRDWLNMPLSDLSRGGAKQIPMQLGNQKVAVNVCYEDVFGEEIISQFPEATLSVNVTNDAWYGKSIAADQHMQFSQARAIETGRMVLRATNTGATAIIDTHGHVQAYAPQHTQTILTGQAQGFQGVTPYMRWGNRLFLALSFTWLCWVFLRKSSIKTH